MGPSVSLVSTALRVALMVACIMAVTFYVIWYRPEPQLQEVQIDTAREEVTYATTTHITADVISRKTQPPATHTETYNNEKYRFSYRHTPQAKISTYDEGGGAMLLVHENFEKVRGFQVFIVPYDEPTISEERFLADVPSGIRKEVENTTLDGVPAVTFVSHDPHIGETREIWIIYNGYLYEITTFRAVAEWFAPIIQSWDFM